MPGDCQEKADFSRTRRTKTTSRAKLALLATGAAMIVDTAIGLAIGRRER